MAQTKKILIKEEKAAQTHEELLKEAIDIIIKLNNDQFKTLLKKMGFYSSGIH